MAKSQKSEAEVRYAKAQKRAHEASQAVTEAEATARRVNDNTARLKALRLAKEASDLAAKAAAPPPAPRKRKPKAKAAAASIPAAKLNASNDE